MDMGIVIFCLSVLNGTESSKLPELLGFCVNNAQHRKLYGPFPSSGKKVRMYLLTMD